MTSQPYQGLTPDTVLDALESVGLTAGDVQDVVMSAMGGDDFKWKEVIPLAIGLTIATVLIFVNGLGLPFKLFPWS